MKHLILTLLLLAGAALGAEETSVPAIALEKGGTVNGGDFVVGYRFTLEKAATITELGVIDQNGDGKLSGTEPVKVTVWDAQGKELGAGDVALTATAENGAFYTRIPALKLEPGAYVIGAVLRRGGEQFFYDATFTTLPGVRWEEGRFETGAKSVFPQKVRAQSGAYFGPVFKKLGVAGEAPAVPPLRVETPVDRAVFQRSNKGTTEIPVLCRTAGGADESVEVRAIDRQTRQPVKEWEKLAADAKAGEFRGRLALSAGWYQLEFRVNRAGTAAGTVTVEHVGVGEVFVTCGQSNSANHGNPRQKAEDERVSSCDFQTGRWVHTEDPQPGATGGGGSPWPLLGDLLVKKLNVPIGFICVGVGATPVSFWTPSGKGYPRVKAALQRAGPDGVRAVLWHQGESDSIGGTTAEKYAKMLGETIAQSRKDAGWAVPWGVALASFHPAKEATAERQAAIVAGQRKVAADISGVFVGPETDSFHTKGWLSDAVHFNAKGLAAHAQGWADVLLPLIEKASPPPDERKAK